MGWGNNDKYGSFSSGAHAAWKWVEFRTVEFSQTLLLLYDVLASRSRFMKRTFSSLTKRENVFATAVTSLIEHSKTQTEREAVWFVFSSSSALAPGATHRHTATDRRRSTFMILQSSPLANWFLNRICPRACTVVRLDCDGRVVVRDWMRSGVRSINHLILTRIVKRCQNHSSLTRLVTFLSFLVVLGARAE